MTPPSAEALAALKAALGDGGWTDNPADIAPWLTEWRNRWQGHSPLMLTPRSTAEVAAACGFSDQSHFGRQFRDTYGLAPKVWVRTIKSAHDHSIRA